MFIGIVSRVKVLLHDVDLRRWQEDLDDDRRLIADLLAAARRITPARDAKLAALRDLVRGKATAPINPGNRKVMIFTAFADTADYLYRNLAEALHAELGLYTALVTGSGTNRTTRTGFDTSLASILTAFSPRSKERSPEFATAGDLDVIIATDCISEGQNQGAHNCVHALFVGGREEKAQRCEKHQSAADFHNDPTAAFHRSSYGCAFR